MVRGPTNRRSLLPMPQLMMRGSKALKDAGRAVDDDDPALAAATTAAWALSNALRNAGSEVRVCGAGASQGGVAKAAVGLCRLQRSVLGVGPH